ncbi:2-keto-4-pentenoate hydratase [Niveispirillum fermenti]|uniref:2-keto-4-pentenoate hydratase n=1 Tax=Niveispirillum fermenti TaxID=1233113 RepID=UPI003A872C68
MVSIPAISEEIARRFVAARRAATSLPDYPGPIPATMVDAYGIQDIARGLWPTPVRGWKIGMVPPAHRERLGAMRLAGPVFDGNVWDYQAGQTVDLPIIPGGFAAVEGEFVAVLATDMPATGAGDEAEALSLIASIHAGIELAGSPLASINDLGPTVVVSDFGNNAGLIVGPEIAGWREASPESLTVETSIGADVVGTGSFASIPGTPVAAVAFLINHCRERNIALPAGTLVTTGAVTGIHKIGLDQSAGVVFAGGGSIQVRTVAAAAR